MNLWSAAVKVNHFETIPEIHCPIYFFLSKNDYVANHIVAENYFNHLQAEHKKIVWFNEATHEIPNQQPKKFSSELTAIANE